MDLVEGVRRDRDLMLTAVTEAKERGLRLARANADYYAAKNVRALELRAEGMPVSMISNVLKGDDRVSGALFERDCAQVEYDSAREAINAYKLSARLGEQQIAREWGQAGGAL